MRENKILYNQAIKELNLHQGFSHLGSAKGTSPQQFQTLWGKVRVYGWRKNVPVKIQHRTIYRAYSTWIETKPERQTKRKIAEYYQGRYFTIETDPLGSKISLFFSEKL